MANVIERVQKPTLILSHNKTLAAQLYNEFKSFFPENAVEYFVSYYDYYQPEAYIPSTDTYIEKDLAINEEIDRLRLSTTSALLSGRKDVIVVSSVSCLYGIGNPEDFHSNVIDIKVGDNIGRNRLLRHFVDSLYSRNEIELNRGNFRVKGDTVDIYLAYDDVIVRIEFWGEEIESIRTIDPATGNSTGTFDAYKIFPANLFVTTKERIDKAIGEIEIDLGKQVEFFKSIGKNLEAKRLYERVTYDVEMIREIGHCSGIENYSRYFDGREAGTRPFCLLDYFPKDFLTIIDESHVTLPQVRAMYNGDRARKESLVEYGFRLPCAFDNRPLKFPEFEERYHQAVFVSATPGDYEREHADQVAEQVIRPTGLLDPRVEVRPVEGQIDDLVDEIRLRIDRNERTLVTTLTKRMAEDLTNHMKGLGLRVRYMHSDVAAIQRMEIIRDLRLGEFDVLVGINLLREGLDLPEVSLVAILDADKEGFLRSETSLIQTIGRAARNAQGLVILYADTITPSMRAAMDETERRREKQDAYNKAHGIVPQTIRKDVRKVLEISKDAQQEQQAGRRKLTDAEREATIRRLEKEMKEASKMLEFEYAALLRDQIIALRGEK